MKFGKVEHPELVDFTLPADHPDTEKVLKENKNDQPLKVYVGCAKWNKGDLKGFYPKGIKDELPYYSKEFNAIELNSTFYGSPNSKQVEIWRDKTPFDFKFYPKLNQYISHLKRLLGTEEAVREFCDSVSHFKDRLGITFLQLHDNFKPTDYDRLEKFIKEFPKGIPLAVEVRNPQWFADGKENEAFFQLLKKENKLGIIVDTAGRRDMLTMRLTSPEVFIRYVGSNHPSDYTRLDEWVERIVKWHKLGLQTLHFFVHQNVEKESPLLAAYFIKKLNEELGLNLHVPNFPPQAPKLDL